MSRSNNLSKVVVALSVAIVVVALVYWSLQVLGVDPLASYRNPRDNGRVGMQLKNVEMKAYNGGDLVSQADIDRVDVRQDRQFFDLFGMDGIIQNKDGKIDFTTPHATYDAISKKLQFQREAKIKNKDFDLTVPRFSFDENSGVLMMPGQVGGTAFGGQFAAVDAKYNVKDRIMITGPIRWQGKLSALNLQEGKPIQDQKTDWLITGKKSKVVGSKTLVTTGRATDGEILVKADTIEHDSETDVVVATGNVYYFSDKANAVCDKAVIDRKKKIATLTDNIRMLVKPKDMPKMDLEPKEEEIPPFRPDVPASIAQNRPAASTEEAKQQDDLTEELRSGKTLRKYPLHLKATKIVYWYADGERRAEVEGNPEGFQEIKGGSRRLLAIDAFYDAEKDLLTLNGTKEKPVKVSNTLGDLVLTNKAIVSTEEGKDEYETEEIYPGSKIRGNKSSSETGSGSTGSGGGGGTTTTGGGGGTTGG